MAIRYKHKNDISWTDTIQAPSKRGCAPPPAPLRTPIVVEFDHSKSWGYMRQAIINTSLTMVRQRPLGSKLAEAMLLRTQKVA